MTSFFIVTLLDLGPANRFAVARYLYLSAFVNDLPRAVRLIRQALATDGRLLDGLSEQDAVTAESGLSGLGAAVKVGPDLRASLAPTLEA